MVQGRPLRPPTVRRGKSLAKCAEQSASTKRTSHVQQFQSLQISELTCKCVPLLYAVEKETWLVSRRDDFRRGYKVVQCCWLVAAARQTGRCPCRPFQEGEPFTMAFGMQSHYVLALTRQGRTSFPFIQPDRFRRHTGRKSCIKQHFPGCPSRSCRIGQHVFASCVLSIWCF